MTEEAHKSEKKEEGTIKIPKKTFFFVIGFVIIFIVGFAFGRITANPTGAVLGGSGSNLPSNGAPSNGAGSSGGAISVSADDDPFLGSEDASITIIEFSDFQCPFCRRHYTQTWTQLKADYVDTGKVMYVYRDFPLSFHEGAQDYAEAAECAEEQGKFWEMHDKIFDEQNKQGQGTIPYPGRETLIQWSAEIGLDSSKLSQCLNSGKYRQEVQKDFNDGVTAGVSGTPTFFIGNDKSGWQSLVGAQPYSAFQAALSELAA